uniref:Neogenin n=1 Tax=Plectus sambesii TaxID=2011161 RepID=A0A914WAK2_9BILA
MTSRWAPSVLDGASSLVINTQATNVGSVSERIHRAIQGNGTLMISRVVSGRPGSNDEGVYQCVVGVTHQEDAWAFVSRKARLRIATLPRFEQQPSDQRVVRGETAVFMCRLDAIPPAAIQWFRNGQQLDIASDINMTVYPLSGTLEIVNVEDKHAGVYKCEAKNSDKARFSSEGKLTVVAAEDPTDVAEPVFVLEPTGQVVMEGDSAVLECVANGFPIPEIRWLKEDKAVTVDDDRIKLVGRSSLLIHKLTSADAGTYTCRATNNEDSADASAALEVKVAPSFSSAPRHAAAQETTDVEFECSAVGKPGPAVTWYKNGEVITASEYFVIEGTKLKVLGLVKNDQGVYQCLAENEAGSVQTSAQLLVDMADTTSSSAENGAPRVPSEPLGLRVTASTSRYVSLRWDAPLRSYGELLAYSVFFKEKNSTRERVINSTGQSATVNQLQPDSIYFFRIVGFNENGAGQSTPPIKVTTDHEQAVPGKVRDLKGHALNPTTIEIEWKPPSPDGAAPKHYKLFYVKTEPDEESDGAAAAAADDYAMETEITTSQTSYTLHGLDKFATYSFRVEAEGDNGPGLSSDSITVRTYSDAPSAPPRDVMAEPSSTNTMVVQWRPPPASDRNGLITGYRVKYKTKLRGSKGQTFVVDGDTREHTITGLDPGTHYLVRVAAVNQNATGPNSEWVRVATFIQEKEEQQIPGPPTSLKVQPHSDTIQLSWTAPLDNGIMVRGYLIGWGINVPDVEQTRVSASHRYYTIEGLKPGRDYVVSLRAFNRMGNGFPIYETVRTMSPGDAKTHGPATAKENVPIATPMGVQANTDSSTAIKVSWIDGDLDATGFGGVQRPRDGRQYSVRYSSSFENNGQHRFLNASETQLLVDGLKPNTQYEFSVRVVMGRSASQWSMSTFNRTAASAPSSAPRDLTAVRPASGDPLSVMLNWQPPKFSNGEIEEYLIFYSDQPDQPDNKWTLEGVQGDRLSTIVHNLLPKTTYYFKIQARNGKGYGPFSSVLQYVAGAASGTIVQPNQKSPGSDPELSPAMIMIAIAVITFLACAILILVGVFCCRRRRGRQGYTAGKKANASKPEVKPPPDLWINHPHGHELQNREQSSGSADASMQDLKRALHPRASPPPTSIDSPPPRYHSLGDGPARPDAMTRSAYAPDSSERRVGRAKPMMMGPRHGASSTSGYVSDADSNGTLSRSYHQSSGSLEGPSSARQRTPQVVYTGPRHQQTARVDFADQRNSPYGSATAMGLIPTPPPQLPLGGPPSAPPSSAQNDGYRTLPHRQSSNPLKSFTAVAGPPPPPPAPSCMSDVGPSSPNPQRTAHVVRPVVVSAGGRQTSSPVGRPAGVVVGTKHQPPVGRAAPSPRLQTNGGIGSIYSSYATCGIKDKDDIEQSELEHSRSLSTEELNAQMQNLDTMIDDLQAMQHEFNGV